MSEDWEFTDEGQEVLGRIEALEKKPCMKIERILTDQEINLIKRIPTHVFSKTCKFLMNEQKKEITELKERVEGIFKSIHGIAAGSARQTERMDKYKNNCYNCTKEGNYDIFQCPKDNCIPERDFIPKERPPDATGKLIKEFLEDLNGYLHTDVDDAIGYFMKVWKKWEKRLKNE